MKQIVILSGLVISMLSANAQTPVSRKAVPQIIQQALMDSTNKATMKNAWYTIVDEDYVVSYDYTVYRFTYDAKFVYKLKYIDYKQLPDSIYQDFKQKYDEQFPFDSAWDVLLANGEKQYWILANKKKSPAQYYYKYTLDAKLIAKTETNR